MTKTFKGEGRKRMKKGKLSRRVQHRKGEI